MEIHFTPKEKFFFAIAALELIRIQTEIINKLFTICLYMIIMPSVNCTAFKALLIYPFISVQQKLQFDLPKVYPELIT